MLPYTEWDRDQLLHSLPSAVAGTFLPSFAEVAASSARPTEGRITKLPVPDGLLLELRAMLRVPALRARDEGPLALPSEPVVQALLPSLELQPGRVQLLKPALEGRDPAADGLEPNAVAEQLRKHPSCALHLPDETVRNRFPHDLGYDVVPRVRRAELGPAADDVVDSLPILQAREDGRNLEGPAPRATRTSGRRTILLAGLLSATSISMTPCCLRLQNADASSRTASAPFCTLASVQGIEVPSTSMGCFGTILSAKR